MAESKPEYLTAGAIAKELKISGTAVSKAIQTLGLKPEMKKGPCNYYSQDALKKIKTSLK